MPLSEHEQRILEQLERELASEDPKLATTMSDGPRPSFARVAVAIIGVVVGLLMLIIGVSQSLAVVGILGFAVMVAAVVFASTPSKKTQLRVVDGKSSSRPARGGSNVKPKQAKSKGSFTQRMEERWEKRQREG
ncbi:DUF3040 domain-containing protein [Populibacterium corticicola]|uniref:DUF3040 domain-containing protein n=1 Tax=Populibacterium corticicola TaxID=1812826 RepID=A0ABW5XHT5_9MICO